MPDRVESIPIHRDDVNVGVLLEVTTEVLERQARAQGVRLLIHIDERVPTTVRVDRNKIAWAIASLVGAALRHVQGPGALVLVEVTRDAHAQLVISVRDNGAGMPPEQLKKLLRRDGWHPGSALALLLVEDIVAAHGGRLEVESRADALDHFTNVRMTIPVV